MNLPDSVTINEVGLRDGLQLEKKIINTEEKEKLVSLLEKAGVRMMEFGSFVHPKAVPQMADTKYLYQKIQHRNALRLIALIPNYKGLQLAHQAGVEEVNYVFSVSDTHNQQNVKLTTEESLRGFSKLKDFCKSNGIKLNVTLATSFGCPFEGEIRLNKVLDTAEHLISEGVNILTFADTTGMANPSQVYSLSEKVTSLWEGHRFGLHFHNTRGMGLANILAGFQGGISLFDTSLGGLGGCPFAPGATGNVCTEDVVHMFEEMGVYTGIDIHQLIVAAKKLEEVVGHDLPGQVVKSGTSLRRYSVPAS